MAFAPTYMNEAEEVMILGYADLRIPITKVLHLTLQPGYNFYEYNYATSGSTYRTSVSVKGGFTGAAGFTIYDKPFNPKGARFFGQLKYNYFSFNSKAESRISTRTSTGSYRTTTSTFSDTDGISAITFSLGVSF